MKSSTEVGNRDGDIIHRKIVAFLNEKKLPQEKWDLKKYLNSYQPTK